MIDGQTHVVVGQARCADCPTLAKFDQSPKLRRDGSIAIGLSWVELDARRLRCPECSERIFGPELAAPGAAVERVECGDDHVVVMKGGATFRFFDGHLFEEKP